LGYWAEKEGFFRPLFFDSRENGRFAGKPALF
jgi:hypothetical protein